MAAARIAMPDAGHDEQEILLLGPDLLVRLEGPRCECSEYAWYGDDPGGRIRVDSLTRCSGREEIAWAARMMRSRSPPNTRNLEPPCRLDHGIVRGGPPVDAKPYLPTVTTGREARQCVVGGYHLRPGRASSHGCLVAVVGPGSNPRRQAISPRRIDKVSRSALSKYAGVSPRAGSNASSGWAAM